MQSTARAGAIEPISGSCKSREKIGEFLSPAAVKSCGVDIHQRFLRRSLARDISKTH
jgi:hypothetical protein